MKKLKKVLKILLIIVISLTAFVYGGVFLGHKVIFKENTSSVQTIQAVTDGTFTFGPQENLPATIDEFIPLIAEQVRIYNEIAPTLWDGNAVVNQSVIVEALRKNKFWLIAPDGTVTSLTKKEVDSKGISHAAYVNGFSFFEGGAYIAITEKDLTNYLIWQQYLHLGTPDPILFFTHESFHAVEQPKWRAMDNIPNRGRSEFLENTSARAKRALLQNQLLKAVSEPDNAQLIFDALATYEDYKNQFPDDYKNSHYFDRIEGTAYYFELITGLYIGYPDQIKNKDDLDRALALLATREDIYVWHGLVAEGYIIGGFSCALLDRLGLDWQEELMNDPEATPIEMLYKQFEGETLPDPVQLTQSEIDAVGEEINKPDENSVKGMPLLFKMLYDLLF